MKTRKSGSRRAALLLTLLVFPGLGHWHLGHRQLGGLIAALTTVAFLYPLAQFTRTLRQSMDVMFSTMAPTSGIIWAGLRTAWNMHRTSIFIGGLALLVLWGGACLDLLRRKERASSRG
ncbi:MAG: hypothetical protein HYV02_02045 [Deltaproteobacteria bacterium]|nr:hypothetical protein [Deltaproteobacteria bacterium]